MCEFPPGQGKQSGMRTKVESQSRDSMSLGKSRSGELAKGILHLEMGVAMEMLNETCGND